MSDDTPSSVRTFATLGLAVCGPATLLSGLITLATVPTGVPPAIVVIFLVSAGATALFVLLYMADDAKRRH